MGNAHPNIVPYQVFATRDAHVIIAVGNDVQFARLCAYLGHPEIPQDSRFATNPGRVLHREELCAQLAAEFLCRNRDEVLGAMEALGVPAGPINSLADVFADPQVRHRQMQLSLPAPWSKDGTLPGIRTPIQFSDARLACERAAPRLGEHTEQILEELRNAREPGGP
jgi:crotonobetainyl-CoA:carnitine CoA-transferase CaiB-like acyl-CoA transferase